MTRLLRAPARELTSESPSNSWSWLGRDPGSADNAAPRLPIQRKLAVSKPGDTFEVEADRIAEQVMRMPERQLEHAGTNNGRGAGCGNNKATNDCLQTKRAGASGAGGIAAPPIVHETLRSSGQPLSASTRKFMETRFGHDFGHVRTHTDTRAAESAGAVNAQAYTVGRHIVFGSGQFAPDTSAGRRLLAHELTHVLQQGSAGRSIQRKPGDKAPCTVHAYDNSAPKDTAIVPADGSGVGVSSVPDLVTKVNAYIDDPKNNCSCVNRLEINGHGTDGYQSVGNGNKYVENDKALIHDSKDEHLKLLAKIKFCAMGLFMMVGCHVGQGKGKDLLKRLSAILPGKLIGGAQHYTSPTSAGGPRVAGAGDALDKGNLPTSMSDPFLTSKFVRWHLTIGGEEFIINGDEVDSAGGKSKLKAADKIKVKTPDGKLKIIKK